MKPDLAARVKQLAEQHGQTIFIAAYRILGNADDADDVFQDVFLRLLSNGRGLLKANAVQDWDSYLRVAASRSAIDLFRRKLKRRQKNAEWCERHPDTIGNGRRTAGEREWTAYQVRQTLAALPTRDAQILALRYFEDMSYKEIAVQTGLSVSQVGVLLHRGRGQLYDLLKQRMAPTLCTQVEPLPKTEK